MDLFKEEADALLSAVLDDIELWAKGQRTVQRDAHAQVEIRKRIEDALLKAYREGNKWASYERDCLQEVCAGIREIFGYHPTEPVDLVTFVAQDVGAIRRAAREAAELLEQSAQPFDSAAMKVREIAGIKGDA